MLNDFIKMQSIIENNNIFMIGRLSGNETSLSGKIKNNIQVSKELIHNTLYVAGIYFKNEDSIKRYVDLYYDSIKSTDLLCIWDGIMKMCAKEFYNDLENMNINTIPARCIEPYYFMDDENYNFNKIIKNKKLLIISSHIETMKLQLDKLDKLFEKKIFENNEFVFLKPPITNGDNHNNIDWEINFNEFKNKIPLDFDIALISCGGYGMIITSFIKNNLNKSCIYVGGALQIWFGIKGNRWDNHPIISKFYNDYWIRPLNNDKPKNTKCVENNCYW